MIYGDYRLFICVRIGILDCFMESGPEYVEMKYFMSYECEPLYLIKFLSNAKKHFIFRYIPIKMHNIYFSAHPHVANYALE